MDTNTRARRWLSRPFTELAQSAAGGEPASFDVVIVGSGYGGAISAHHLSALQLDDKPLSICLLERGGEYLEGMFPASASDLPAHVRVTTTGRGAPAGNREGLFDLRLGGDVSALVGNGLGGGSLINAGVMLPPPPGTFEKGWPSHVTAQEMQGYFDECTTLLRAKPASHLPPKFHSLSALAGGASAAPITVSMVDEGDLKRCTRCGNCATGCNVGAKASLDVSLLAEARRMNPGLLCVTGASVERVSRREENGDNGWDVHVHPTASGLRARYPEPTVIRCRFLVIAAGTFGSTELLMKSRAAGLAVSAQLGERFSTNGDMLAFGYGQSREARAIATDTGRPGADGIVGPTITGFVDRHATDGILLEEMAVPFAIREIFEQTITTSNALHELETPDFSRHRAGSGFDDPFALDAGALASTSVYALMGDDGAGGRLVLADDFDGEGGLRVSWPDAGAHPLFGRQMALLSRLAEASEIGGRMIANPVWRPLPASLSYVTDDKTGPLFTVHPLGGCSMAQTGADGVVDHLGRVFKGDRADVYDDLVVLDGSIVPRSLGTNPALTISALALRAIRNLSVIWGLRTNGTVKVSLPERPQFHVVEPEPAKRTTLSLEERLVGTVTLADETGRRVPRVVELTLSFAPASPQDMTGPLARRMALEHGRVRVFDPDDWAMAVGTHPSSEALEARLEETAESVHSLSGHVELFGRDATLWPGRVLRALSAWLLNRGLRDAWQTLIEDDESPDIAARLRGAFALASRAGERRNIVYRFTIDKTMKGEAPRESAVVGRKVMTYSRASNPLRQLMALSLESFPGLSGRGQLELDPSYLARIGVPLFRVREQQDAVRTAVDVLALVGYLVRLMIAVHGWSFRKPDAITSAQMSRLPGELPNVPVFEQFWLRHPDTDEQLPVKVTHYARDGAEPVVTFHGYSASGTTFAHASLSPSFAEMMWREGFDVWVVDFRTSPGLDSSSSPWDFENVATIDVPLSIDYIFRKTGRQVHVVAHCMGAAMFSMALLGDGEGTGQRELADRIASVVLTQVGPGVVFTPANIFRGYVLNYLKHFLSLTRFDFRVDSRESLPDQLLDRLLSVLPYPRQEFLLENPWLPWKRAEFVSIRHRMDMLYGRDFSLGNVTGSFLDNIDAMFGPLNLETVSQAIHFTRWKNVTTRHGRNRYYLRRRLRKRWRVPTLSIHGRDNGLSSFETLDRNRQVFEDADVPYDTMLLDGFGHQDIWVSERSTKEVFQPIARFIAAAGEPVRVGGNRPLVAAPPYLGPVQTVNPSPDDTRTHIKFGMSPNLSEPLYVMLLPVRQGGDTLAPDGFVLEPRGVAANAILLPDVPVDDNGMMEISVTLDGGDAWMILLLYDEHPALLESTFGEATFAVANSQARYGVDDEETRIVDAVRATLGKRAERLLPAVITPRTAPRPDRVSIVFASCLYPPGIADKGIAFSAWSRLSARLAGDGRAPDALLLLGDQVYIDATAGLFDPAQLSDRYAIPYFTLLSNDHVRSVTSKVATHMMLDDHEIKNDWEPTGESARDLSEVEAGEKAFRSFQFHSASGRDVQKFFGPVMQGAVPVFMLNTRTDRSVRTVAAPREAGMISPRQLASVTHWLLQQEPSAPKVITCASVPLPRRLDPDVLSEDGFAGYPRTLDDLLSFIATNRIDHVVFLSGDEHLPMVANARIDCGEGEHLTLHSIHTAAHYAPFEFANGKPQDFIASDEFVLRGGEIVTCDTLFFPARDGFTLADFRHTPGEGWSLAITFEGSGREMTLAL
ncbi:MAG: alpha/beta fold hydrolase [Pseudomonadales bacterium]|nr:alpha/beta fold hydrolase [Pseudomonadales bacterium]